MSFSEDEYDDFYDESQDYLYILNENERGSQPQQQNSSNEAQNNVKSSPDIPQIASKSVKIDANIDSGMSAHQSTVPSAKALEMLKKYFGYSKFRPLQYEIIDAAMRKQDQLVVMSTGYGKSVCYQLPSLIQNNLTLVISPLISLMEDQVKALDQAGVEAAYLGPTSRLSRETILHRITEGRLRILYVTPEMYSTSSDFVHKIQPYVGLIAIDEAHCISQWGHEFRPDYRHISKLRNSLPGVPVMALTATATRPVQNDIVENLHMGDPKITLSGFDRKNLYIEVFKRTKSLTFEREVQGDLERLLIDDEKLGPYFGGSTIIYCQSRQNVDQLTDQLRSIGVRAVGYHAGMTSAKRDKSHNDFATDRATTCVATIAFGMGIDKRDVRQVIHYGSPGNIESYYQEIGRAGRDGFPSKCRIFYTVGDMAMHRNRIVAQNMSSKDYEKHKLDMLRRMEQFLTTTSCRRYLILSYFDSTAKHPDTPRADCCDNCTKLLSSDTKEYGGGESLLDFGPESRKLLGVIGEIFNGRSGMNKPIAFLRGLENKELLSYGSNLPTHRLFGSGKDKSEIWWKELGRLLRNNGYLVDYKSHFTQFGCLTKLSADAEDWLLSGSKELKLVPSEFLAAAKKGLPTNEGGGRTRAAVVQEITEKILNRYKVRTYQDASFYASLQSASESNIEIYEKLPVLRKVLEDLRYDISTEMEMAANAVYSNTVVEELIKIRPTKEETLEKIEGLSEHRRRQISKRLLEIISAFCAKHKIATDCLQHGCTELPAELEAAKEELSQTERKFFTAHLLYCLSLEKLSARFNVAVSTVANHLNVAVKKGLPVHFDLLGITTDKINAVYGKVEENRRDIIRMKPIMEVLPEGLVDYNQLKLIFSILEFEFGIKDGQSQQRNGAGADTLALKRKEPSWISHLPTENKQTEPLCNSAKKKRQNLLFKP